MLNLQGTPYTLTGKAETEIIKSLQGLERRVGLLRGNGVLTEETLKRYYGDEKFKQVAESNAIEGSTLSVGETELAILKGVTTTGHDPAYVRDALSLEKALVRLAELAKDSKEPTDIPQLHELHGLIMGDRPGGGMFRNEQVRIKGANHVPPKTFNDVLQAMNVWEEWSAHNLLLPALVRAVVLHAWLAHIHPFADGNGRTARAISNLELVRAGYPPVIMRKKERARYIASLGEADDGGDIRSFFELFLERADGALTGLENSAKEKQKYDRIAEAIKTKHENNLKIWETGVALLVKTIQHHLTVLQERFPGSVVIKEFEFPLDYDDYLALINKKSVQRSWCFIIELSIPCIEPLARLAYIHYRQPDMFHFMGDVGGPAVYWSVKNPEGYPRWTSVHELSPYCTEMTIADGVGDSWSARLNDGTIKQVSTTELAKNIAGSLVDMAGAAQ